MSAGTAGWLLFVLGWCWLFLTFVTYVPLRAGALMSGASFFAGWLTGELALHWVVVEACLVGVLVSYGALQKGPGQWGLLLAACAWLGLAFAYWRGFSSHKHLERALREELGEDYREKVSQPALSEELNVGLLVLPFPERHRGVERLKDIVYREVDGIRLRLDVVRPRARPQGAPVLLQIHGGGWIVGDKNNQGQPLLHWMASRGWVCFNARYRLSPRATLPDPIIDLKAAIAWIREHAHEYGGDPDFLLVTGGSAGAHLCAMLALTPNQARYQPGFEEADTSVSACIPVYGVYDLFDRHGAWPHDGLKLLLEQLVLKRSRDLNPELYKRNSPYEHIHPDAPPFFVIHGDRDSMVPVAHARHFVRSLREQSRAPVVYAELPGAQHAFDVFSSPRCQQTLHSIARFASFAHQQALAQRQSVVNHTG